MLAEGKDKMNRFVGLYALTCLLASCSPDIGTRTFEMELVGREKINLPYEHRSAVLRSLEEWSTSVGAQFSVSENADIKNYAVDIIHRCFRIVVTNPGGSDSPMVYLYKARGGEDCTMPIKSARRTYNQLVGDR